MSIRRAGPWVALVLVLVGALVWGGGDDGPVDAGERTERLRREIACPRCDGQSVAESNAPVADTIRRFIDDQVDRGASDGEIRDLLVASYGKRVLLEPERTGLVGLVWILPIVGLLAGVGGLVWAFRWGRGTDLVAPSEHDREMVERARHHEWEPPAGGEPL
ncbi:MAG: cytochrome c-type biogenesis protein CcmH [Actinomycetia bacterium]|nr:cytochrome c-type biogenesis protein CcmH [Actinomycetes bacterium]